MGFPPKTPPRLRGQPAAPPRPFTSGRGSRVRPELRPQPGLSAAQRPLQPDPRGAPSPPRAPGFPPTSPSFLRTPSAHLPRPVPPGARDPVPFLSPTPLPGAHLAPQSPAGLLRERPPPKSSRPRPAPGRIQFEASQDLPGPLVLGCHDAAAAARGSLTLSCGASWTVPKSRGQSRGPAWTPQASSGSGQTRTGLSLPSAPAPDPFSFSPGLGAPAPKPIESQPQRLASCSANRNA